jgi:hypothetical protein
MIRKSQNPFETMAAERGLTVSPESDIYSYRDRYAEIVFRPLYVRPTQGATAHSTDNFKTNLLSIFTRPNENVGFTYCGHISHIYNFIGHDLLCEKIRSSINSVGKPIIKEITTLSPDLTSIRVEMTIQNEIKTAQAGDIFPTIVVMNNYNGKKAASISFGLQSDIVSFAFNLGSINQIHTEYASGRIAADVQSYLTAFTEGIGTMVENSFNAKLTEAQMFAVLDFIEDTGKRRRENVSGILQDLQKDITPGSANPLPSAWHLFLAITRYSTLESNLNAKRILENIAESVLVVPEKMFNVLKKLQG